MQNYRLLEYDILGVSSEFLCLNHCEKSSVVANIHFPAVGSIMLIVRELKESDEASFRACVQECRQDNPPHDFAFHYDPEANFASYVHLVHGWSRGDLPPNFVPGAFLVAAVEEVVVGRVSIRYELNDYLFRFGGHVGYAVAPSFRRRGYATEILRQTLPIVRSIGLKRILLICDDDNAASQRVIEVRACAEITSHFGASAGRADARRRDAGDAVPSSRSDNAADARPPPRPFGLWPAGPLASLLAPYIRNGMLVAHALPAGLGADSKM